MKVEAFILMGTNMGDRVAHLDTACKTIGEKCGNIVKTSKLYESEPWEFDAKEWFINQIICIKTVMTAELLLKELLDIESTMGRVRTEIHNGYSSRPIDLDIIYYGNEVINQTELIIPHPRLQLRRFVLIPLCEIAPDMIHPVYKITNTKLLELCKDNSTVKLYKTES